MLALDEDSLICDLAETYGIFNYRSLPLKTIATLAVGLRDDSRIKMKMNDEKASADTVLLAAVLDGINTLVWMFSEDGARKVNRPKSAVACIMGDLNGEVAVFSSAEEYERARMRAIGGDG